MKSITLAVSVALCGVAVWAGPDAEKIKKCGARFKEDKMQGYDRIVFDFEGCEAWVVEPKAPAKDGRWVWCMEWPTAFQDRAGAKELLAAGYRWVAFNPAYVGILDPAHGKMPAGNQSDEMVARRGRFQAYLVKTLGLSPKCGLIGMSWGGFYSVRYASVHPQDVAAIYLDAPLLDFTTLSSYCSTDKNTGEKTGEFKTLAKYYDFATADYVGKDDPFQSVNRAVPIAKAKIPVLCIYGGNDGVVPAEKNILRFAAEFEKAGGHLKLWRDNRRGHHPHGLENGEQQVFVNFFDAAFPCTARREPKVSVFASFVQTAASQRGATLEETASRFYDLGVRGFDCSVSEPQLAQLAATKLKPINLYYFPKWTDEAGAAEENARALDAVAKYGVPRIMTIPPNFTDGGDQEAEFVRNTANLKAFVAAAKTRGITVTVEDFGGVKNACSYAKYLKRMLDEIPDLRFALDSGNLYYAGRGEDILDMMAYAKGRIAHVHLKDQPAEDNRRYATLGLGAVPNEAIVKTTWADGYDGWYTLENAVGDVYIDTVRQVAVLKEWIAESGCVAPAGSAE